MISLLCCAAGTVPSHVSRCPEAACRAPGNVNWLGSALPIYAAATLIGAISTLPGGLVGTEGSMVALLQQSGIARGAASAGTLIVRLTTLWFAVAVGLVALAWLNRVRPTQGLTEEGGEPDRKILKFPRKSQGVWDC